MTQPVVKFLKTASHLISDFSDRTENLTNFTNAIELIHHKPNNSDTINKHKTKQSKRRIGRNHNSHLEWRNKTANHTKEIEYPTKSLEGAYTADLLTKSLVGKHSTQQAMKAETLICSIDEVKLVMEARNCTNMKEPLPKFVSSYIEATTNSDTILYSQYWWINCF